MNEPRDQPTARPVDRIMAGLKDARHMVKSARVIANYCYLRGWCKAWGDLSNQERDEFIGVAETLAYQEQDDA